MVDCSAQLRPCGLRLVSSQDQPATDSVSDAQIIQALQNGEPGLGNLLFGRLSPVVQGTLYRVIGHRGSDHEDLVQVAFEQIVLTLMRGRFSQACSLRSWAAAITTRVALNALRSRRMARRVFDLEQDAEATTAAAISPHDPERSADARLRLAHLRQQLGRMSQKLAETLLLHDGFGHDLAEIAALTGVSVAAAQSRLVRGRKELARRMHKVAGRSEA